MSEQKAKCEKCGKAVSEKVKAYSQEHFDGCVYCYTCQKKVRGDEDTGGWIYEKPENAEEKKKATAEDATFDVESSEDKELEEYDSKVTAELKQKSKELDKKIIALVTEMNWQDTEGFYAWLKTVYGVDDLEPLSIEQKEAVLSETEKLAKARESEPVEGLKRSVEIDEGVFSFQRRDDRTLSCSDAEGNVHTINTAIPECSCSLFQKDKSTQCPHLKAADVCGLLSSETAPKKEKEKEKTVESRTADSSGKEVQKKIPINWGKIPVQTLIPKLRKALAYVLENKTGFYAVTKANHEDKEHRTTLDSCDCEDFMYRGTSLNPCVHQIRVKYSDEEIRGKLKELGADELSVLRKKNKDRTAAREPSVGADMMISGLHPHLAEVGKIKIGGKSETKTKTGFLLPEKWDHFEIASLMKDDEGRLVMDDGMNAIIGEDAKSLDISLCYDSIPMNMPTMYSWFSQTKLLCVGDGHVAQRIKGDGSKEEIVCNPKTCPAYADGKCKMYGRLSVILSASNRLGGVYVFRTTSFNSIRNILSSIAFLRQITGGILAGLPLRMTLLPMTVTPRSVGRNVKIYTVNLEYAGSLSQLKEAAVEEVQRRMQLGMNMKQMEETDREFVKAHVVEEARQEAAEIADEFAPEEEE